VGGEQQIAFDASRIEITIERGDEKHRVDVRREDLLLGFVAGDLARKDTLPRQDGFDAGARSRAERNAWVVCCRRVGCIGPERDPVPHRGQLVPAGCLMPQSAGRFGEHLARGGPEAVDVVQFEGDARRLQAFGRERGKCRLQFGAPAGLFQVHVRVIVLRSLLDRSKPLGVHFRQRLRHRIE
jgi:hypothetical protein